MTSKRIFLGLLTIFLLLLAVGVASAATLSLTTLSSPSSVANTDGSLQLTLNVSYAGNSSDSNNVTVSLASSDLVNASSVVFSSSSLVVNKGESSTLTATVNFPSSVRSSVRGTINASSGLLSDIETFNIPVTFRALLCSNGPVGNNLSITDIDISNSGDKDDEWKFLDEITIDVDVENIGKTDMDNFIVGLALLDSSGSNVVGDMDFLNADEEDFELGDLNDGDEETATFEFVVPADIDAEDLTVVVRAYSDEIDESLVCAEEKGDSVSIEKESDEGKFIAFDNIVLSPSEATCGDSVSLNVDAVNIGDEDQDQVRVNLVNRELNINEFFEIKTDLDQGDKKRVTFNFNVPSNVADKTYRLALSSEYDYRNGVYREGSEDDYLVDLRVFGCALAPGTPGKTASITATLDSDAKAGEELLVLANLRNVGNSTASFIIGASGYNSWATLDSISDRTFTLAPGESKDVTFKFTVDKDVSGDQTFTIESISNGKTESREVSVAIESASGRSLSSLFKNNALIWVIGIVNLVLIILIIVVAVRLSRK